MRIGELKVGSLGLLGLCFFEVEFSRSIAFSALCSVHFIEILSGSILLVKGVVEDLFSVRPHLGTELERAFSARVDIRAIE